MANLTIFNHLDGALCFQSQLVCDVLSLGYGRENMGQYNEMLRITIHENSGMKTIQLEGKLAGPWVSELNRVWGSFADSTVAGKLQIDLREVAFVDANGKKLLQQIYQQASVGFLTASPLTRHFAEEAMLKSQKHKVEEI